MSLQGGRKRVKRSGEPEILYNVYKFMKTESEVGISSDMTKAELYDLIKMHKPQYETFATDCLLAEHGHTVIRLPPYHPDLNPTEKIWGIVKARIAAKNVTFKLGDVQQLAEQHFALIHDLLCC